MNLREQHGYTYGAGSFLATIARRECLEAMQASNGRDRAGDLGAFQELRRMRDTPHESDEMSLAKDFQHAFAAGRFGTRHRRGRDFRGTFTYDLPWILSKPAGKPSIVTADRRKERRRGIFVPEKMIVLAVGDRGKIEEEMKKLNLGKMEIRDTEGKWFLRREPRSYKSSVRV